MYKLIIFGICFVLLMLTGCTKSVRVNEPTGSVTVKTTATNGMDSTSSPWIEEPSSSIEADTTASNGINSTNHPQVDEPTGSVTVKTTATNGINSTNHPQVDEQGANTTEEIEPDDNNTNYITIYQISRDDFLSFLEAPSITVLSDKSEESFKYSGDEESHITYENLLFDINETFVEFIRNHDKLEKFLLQNGIDTVLKNVAVFESERVPITIFIETTGEKIFVTVNEEPEDIDYVYRCYTYSEYYNKYGRVYGKVIANGKELPDTTPVKMYNGYAEVPLVSVLEAFGATVSWKDTSNAKIVFCGEAYSLCIEPPVLYNSKDDSEDLLHSIDGGRIFVYAIEKDVMVDTATLNFVFYEMGMKINVVRDKENATVVISKR